MVKNKNQKGFTLLELLVVIGIIGLLASIIVVNLTGARRRARDTKRIADIRNLQTAVEDYYGKNGFYPVSISKLVGDGQIPIWPMDPLNSSACEASNTDGCYYYSVYKPTGASGPQSYHMGASLEESGSQVLNQDRDCNSTLGGVTNGCPSDTGPFTNGTTPNSGFNGKTDLVGCGGVTGRYCYDIAQ